VAIHRLDPSKLIASRCQGDRKCIQVASRCKKSRSTALS